MRGSVSIVSVMLLVLGAATGVAEPTVESLLSLNGQGMSEGDRLQNASYCLAAGRAAYQAGKLGTALDLFNKCLELNGEEMEAHLEKGLLFRDDRVALRTLAISELLLYVSANPSDGHALAELADQYRRLGRIAEAEERFKAAVAQDPGDPMPKGGYGAMLIQLSDRVQEGVGLEVAAVKGIPDEPWFRMNLAWGYVRLEKYKEARAAAAAAIAAINAKPGWGSGAVEEMNRLLRTIEGK